MEFWKRVECFTYKGWGTTPDEIKNLLDMDIRMYAIIQKMHPKYDITNYIDDKTFEVLRLCTPHYSYVAIQTRTKHIPFWNKYGMTRLSISCQPLNLNTRLINGWPAIWNIVEQVYGKTGGGNPDQVYLDYHSNPVYTPGVYRNYKGQWYKLYEPIIYIPL